MRANGTPYPGLPAAIAAVREGHPDRPDLHALAWALLPCLPGRPRTSANLKEDGARSELNALEDVVLSDPWLGMNTEDAVNVLWSETDKPGLHERLALMREWGVPVQAWTARGTIGGHAGFIIKAPVVTGYPGKEEADRKRMRKLSLTRSLLTTAIDGDHHAGLRGMTKNPFSARWTVEVGSLEPVKLDEVLVPLQAMAKALGWKAPKRRHKGDRKLREPSPEGRNCHLFDLTRWWAGDGNVRDGAVVLAKALQVNDEFANPLGYGEVACVARSITRFMVHRYDGRGRHVPMAPAELKARQAVGRAAHAERQRAERDERLLAAVARIRERGDEPCQAAVAAEACMSLSTVKRAWGGIWDRIVNMVSRLPLSSGNSTSHAHEAAPAALPEASSPALDAATHPLDGEAAQEPVPDSTPRLAWRRRRGIGGADRDARQANLGAFTRLAPRIVRLADLPWNGHVQKPVDWSPEAMARRRRQESKWRCGQREAEHEAAARGGLRAYRDTVAGRFAALFRERKAALEAAAMYPEEGADPVVAAAARERMEARVKLIRMAYAAKAKAETRISRRWDDELQVREQGALHPFRTHLDAVDRMARALPLTPEQAAAQAVRERPRVRMAA